MLIKRVSKSGGSLVVPLPKNFLASAELKRGDYCSVHVNSNQEIVISKLKDQFTKEDK